MRKRQVHEMTIVVLMSSNQGRQAGACLGWAGSSLALEADVESKPKARESTI
jgi:hypothetical protein